MNTKKLILFTFILICGLVALVFPTHDILAAKVAPNRPFVYILDIDGTINPALADFVTRGIRRAEEKHAAALVIRMDTPGGDLEGTKTIIKHMINARVPVVVYVAPSGSSASSAGALITMAADVAAMAPGTNIGAAHPVSLWGQDIGHTMSEKITNDITAYMRGIVTEKGRNAEWVDKAIRESVSITNKEALKIKVIDLIADSVPDLLNKIDGRTIQKQNHSITLKTKNAIEKRIPAGWRFKVLDAIANPNVAYILFFMGIVGIATELYHPGAVLPGVVGGISLLLFFFTAQVLPVNYVGILLIVLALILFIAELKIQSFGLLGVGGIISLTLGSVMLFHSDEGAMGVSWGIIIPTVTAVSVFFMVVLGLVVKARIKKPMTGQQGLEGEIGFAITDLGTEGKVAVHGEYWNARSDTHIAKGERVRVIRVEDLCLLVTRDIG
jgi:membrane-bound serine protease (ClpP class)